MKGLNFPITAKRKNLKQLLYLVVVIFALLAIGYFIATNWQSLSLPESFSRFPAGMFVLFEGEEEAEEEDLLDKEEEELEEEKYLEKAGKGEGMTHLARRVLEKYLQKNPQDFEVTAEHKVYTEDYIVKKMEIDWLELGQEIEISLELIEEAIRESSGLSSQQLDNLTQYARFVAF